MRKLLLTLWHDDGGCVLAMEWMFVASILSLAAIAGLFAMRNSSAGDPADWPAAVSR